MLQGMVRQCPRHEAQARGSPGDPAEKRHSRLYAISPAPTTPRPRGTGGVLLLGLFQPGLHGKLAPRRKDSATRTQLPGPQTPTGAILRVRVLRGRRYRDRGLCQLQVVLALLPHSVRVGAAGVPLHPDPAVLPKLADHTAQAGRGSVLRGPEHRPVRGVQASHGARPEGGCTDFRSAEGSKPAYTQGLLHHCRSDAHTPNKRGRWGKNHLT